MNTPLDIDATLPDISDLSREQLKRLYGKVLNRLSNGSGGQNPKPSHCPRCAKKLPSRKEAMNHCRKRKEEAT